MGVARDDVLMMGRLAVAAGRLEAAGWWIAVALRRDPRGNSFKEVVTGIRQAIAERGVPDYAHVEPNAISDWLERALSAMDQRDRWLHAFFAQRKESGKWASVSQHLKSGGVDYPQPLTKLVQQIKSLANDGLALHLGLLRELTDGVFLKQYRLCADEPYVVIRHGDDADFPRPTDDQVDAWAREYGIAVLSEQATGRRAN
jgi:hypothetical protein